MADSLEISHQKIADYWVSVFAADGFGDSVSVKEALHPMQGERAKDFIKLLKDGRVDEVELQAIQAVDGKESDFYKIAEKIGSRPRQARLERLKGLLLPKSGSDEWRKSKFFSGPLSWSNPSEIALVEIQQYGRETEFLSEGLLSLTGDENPETRKWVAGLLGMVAPLWDSSLQLEARKKLEALSADPVGEVKEFADVASLQMDESRMTCFSAARKKYLIQKLHELNEKIAKARDALESGDMALFRALIKEAITKKWFAITAFPPIQVGDKEDQLAFFLIYGFMYHLDQFWTDLIKILNSYKDETAVKFSTKENLEELIRKIDIMIKHLGWLLKQPWGKKGSKSLDALEKLKRKLEEAKEATQECIDKRKANCKHIGSLVVLKKDFFESLFSAIKLWPIYRGLKSMDIILEEVIPDDLRTANPNKAILDHLRVLEFEKKEIIDDVKKTPTCKK